MSREKAAEELIKSQDNLRELQKAGKATQADVDRVKAANKNYTDASKTK